MRRTARAMSVAVLAGAALVIPGPAAFADPGAGESPGAVRPEAPATVPGPVTVPGSCDGTGAGAVPQDGCASGDARQTPAPQQGLGQTQQQTQEPGDGGTQGDAQGQWDQQQGQGEGDGLWQEQGQGEGQDQWQSQTPGQDQNQNQNQGRGQGQEQGCEEGGSCEDGGADGCRASGGDDDCTPAHVEHGVEAGQGGTFEDSVPALVAGGVLIAAAGAGAGYRILGRRRAAGG
ncbi:hypothetical protein AB0N92_11485 [Streptomyces sp. NPDC093248]|uniref:hypothetical protein n=1 Tax=Streptomyces sp. NPDC093248 TaxID=3155072 RepID=UPI00342C2422